MEPLIRVPEMARCSKDSRPFKERCPSRVDYWVAVKELNLSDYIGDNYYLSIYIYIHVFVVYIYIYRYTHYGILI